MAFDWDAFGKGASDLGGAAASLFSIGSAQNAVSRYATAADLLRQQEGRVQQTELIQQYAIDRKVAETLGSQQAGIAAAGFAESGTALDLLRDSTTQGALSHAMLRLRAGAQEADLEAQHNAAEAEAKAARGSIFGDVFGGLLKGASGVARLGAMFL